MTAGKTILGIDLRVNSVKFVESEGTTIKNWGLTEIPFELVEKHPQKEEAQADALLQLIKTRRIKTKEAAVIVGGSDVYVKLITLVDVSPAELTEAIKWKFAEEIPFPIEDGIVDFYPLPRAATASTNKKDYLAACIPQKLYQEIDYIIRKAGLKLVSLVIIPDALQKVFEPEMIKERGKVIALMYMGKRTTNISIFKDVNLEFNRELNIGGENITLAMSGVLVTEDRRIEVSPAEAERIKRENGVPIDAEKYPQLTNIPVAQLQAMVRPALERVQGELTKTFEYYKGQTGEAVIDKIFLTGGSSLTQNLAEFLAEGIGTPVTRVNVAAPQQIDGAIEDKDALEKNLPRLSTAYGAALVNINKINLLPEDKKHHWKIMSEKILKPQFILPVFALCLLLIYGLCWSIAFNLQNRIDNMQAKIELSKPRLAALDRIEQERQAEETRRKIYAEYGAKRIKFPLLVKSLSQLAPRSIVFTVLEITPTSLHLWGTAFADQETAENILSQFVIMLAKAEHFKQVKLMQATKNYDYVQDALNFEIMAEINM